MSNLFYRNRQLLIIVITLIVVWGTSSFFSLPRLEDPDLVQRYALVTTEFPGANAERVEALVTQIIEDELTEIEELTTIESVSRQGFSSLTLELDDQVTQMDNVWSKVRDRLGDVTTQLPAGTSEPQFEKSQTKANALIIALTWQLESTANYNILHRLASELGDQLRLIEGTEQIDLYGVPDEEITVEIRPDELATLGITVQALSQQIENYDAKVASGQLYNQDNQLLFQVNGELDSLDRIRNIPIQFGVDGQVRRLGALAHVSKTVVQPASELAIVSGKPAVVIGAVVNSDQRLDIWREVAERVLKKYERRLPHGVVLKRVFDQNYYVQARLHQVMMNLVLSVLLVTLVTLFLMGWRSALIMCIALPLVVLTVFGAMKVSNIPLHQISVTGIIISLGLLIDNAIIVVDEMQHRLQQRLAPGQAVTDTFRHISVPLLASTLTTVLAFLPIAISTGATGEFTNTIGLTVILALISSFGLSLTIVPALVARLHQYCYRQGTQHQRFNRWWQSGFSSAGLTQGYRQTLNTAFSRPLICLGLIAILPISGFFVLPTLEQQFFPPSDRKQCYVEFELPPQTSLSKTQDIILQSRDTIRNHPDVIDVEWFAGRSAPKFYYNVLSERQNSANYAQGIVQIKSSAKLQPLIQSLQQELDEAFPTAQSIVRQLGQGPPFAAPIELRVYGPDLNQLRELGEQLRSELVKDPDVIHTRSILTDTLPQLALEVDEEQAQLAGIDKTAIAQQLNAYLDGVVGGSVLEMTEELPVRVRLADGQRRQLDHITSLNLLPEVGNATPLSALAKIQLLPTTATISRRNGQRVNTVQGFITAGVLPATVLSNFQNRLKANNFELPAGYSYELGGEANERSLAISNLVSTLGVLLILMASTLVLTFKSFRLASIIALVALLSIGLGFFSLWLFGYPFGFMSILGTVGLLGIVVNDSIVMLSAIHEDERVRQGNMNALCNVVVHSTRHIIATTATTAIGFLPLMFDPSGFWPPLAITVIGGLMGATLIALYFVPAIYLLMRQKQPQAKSSPSIYGLPSQLEV